MLRSGGLRRRARNPPPIKLVYEGSLIGQRIEAETTQKKEKAKRRTKMKNIKYSKKSEEFESILEDLENKEIHRLSRFFQRRENIDKYLEKEKGKKGKRKVPLVLKNCKRM